MFERIVVPLSGSAFAEAALSPACELAARFGSELVLTTGVQPPNGAPDHYEHAPDSTSEADELQEMDAYLREQVEHLRAAGYRVDLALFTSAPGPGIAKTAELRHADLIVMATRLGWTLPLEGPRRQSVTLDVMARSLIPILSWHEVGAATSLLPEPAGSGSSESRLAGPGLPIVVPLDGSALSRQALATAVTLAQAFDAHLVLVAAVPWQARLQDTQDTRHTPRPPAGLEKSRKYLEEIRTELDSRGVAATATVEIGSPVNVIEHTWREHGAGLVVMASHGRGRHRVPADRQPLAAAPIEHLEQIGSVAAAVLEELEVPTLVMQPGT